MILDLLNRYQPTLEEIDYKKQMIAFIEKHPDCFERTLSIGHITGSAWLLNQKGDSVLLTHHAKLHLWAQLGGHCDGDPDVLRVALREAQEESGILGIVPLKNEIFDLDIHEIPMRKQEPAHLHYDIRFLFQVISDEEFRISSESKNLQWFSKDLKDFPTQERSILRMHEKWLKL